MRQNNSELEAIAKERAHAFRLSLHNGVYADRDGDEDGKDRLEEPFVSLAMEVFDEYAEEVPEEAESWGYSRFKETDPSELGDDFAEAITELLGGDGREQVDWFNAGRSQGARAVKQQAKADIETAYVEGFKAGCAHERD
jgi:hypothetical protein